MATQTQQDAYITSQLNKIDSIVRQLILEVSDDLVSDRAYKGANRENAYKTFLKSALKSAKEIRSLFERGIR